MKKLCYLNVRIKNEHYHKGVMSARGERSDRRIAQGDLRRAVNHRYVANRCGNVRGSYIHCFYFGFGHARLPLCCKECCPPFGWRHSSRETQPLWWSNRVPDLHHWSGCLRAHKGGPQRLKVGRSPFSEGSNCLFLKYQTCCIVTLNKIKSVL